jgi:hypothetical protein
MPDYEWMATDSPTHPNHTVMKFCMVVRPIKKKGAGCVKNTGFGAVARVMKQEQVDMSDW